MIGEPEQQPITCPRCGSVNIIKKGFYYPQRKGLTEGTPRQRYQCLICKRRFVIRPYDQKKFDDDVVKLALISCRHLKYPKVKEIVEETFGVYISRTTLWRWKKQFSQLYPSHKWKKLPDGKRQCKNCGMILTLNQYKRGKYGSCPNSPNIPKTIETSKPKPKLKGDTKITDFLQE